MLVFFQTASHVMRHLETKREAAERRRVSLMSKGIAKFLETSSLVTEADLDNFETSSGMTGSKSLLNYLPTPPMDGLKQSHSAHITEKASPEAEKGSSDILDKIKITLDEAANILRESLELTSGGVVFLDTALGHRAAGTTSSYFDLYMDDSLGSELTPTSKGKTSCASAFVCSISDLTRYSSTRR